MAQVAGLISETTRSRLLSTMMDGRAHTATELAIDGEVMPATASFHLSKLVAGGLVEVARQGRHRYYRIRDHEVAAAIETIMGVAGADTGGEAQSRIEHELRQARTCYDHLAGEYAVRFYDALVNRGVLVGSGREVAVTPEGDRWFSGIGISVERLRKTRRALCRGCLDWSERRFHLAGAIGAAVMEYLLQKQLVVREPHSRQVAVSSRGIAFLTDLGLR